MSADKYREEEGNPQQYIKLGYDLKLLMLIQVSERERGYKRRESQLSFNANLISSYGGSKPRYILNPEKRKTLIRTRRSRSFVEADRGTRIDETIFGELSVSHKETAH